MNTFFKYAVLGLCLVAIVGIGIFAANMLSAPEAQPQVQVTAPPSPPPDLAPVAYEADAPPAGAETERGPEMEREEEIDLANEPPDDLAALGEGVYGLVVLGIDTSAERERLGMGFRSDTMLVLAVDSQNRSCTAISVPRDTRVTVRKLKDGQEQKRVKTKINAAYAYGGDNDVNSASNALYSLSKLLDVELTKYVTLNIDALGPLADAVGGVEVVLPADIDGLGDEGDKVLLTGNEANRFIRARHGVEDGSDLSRIDRQSVFLKAFGKKLMDQNLITLIPTLLVQLSGKIKTNLSLDEMLSLGSALKGLDTEAIDFVTIPGRAKTIDGTGYFICDEDQSRELARSAFNL